MSSVAAQAWRMNKKELGRLVFRVIVDAGKAMSSQRISIVAAGCAFYATLALIPGISMLISIYGLAFNPSTVVPQLIYLQRFMPPEVYSMIADRITSLVSLPAQGLSVSFAFSLAVSLWSASAGTKAVMNALTIAYGEEETRGIIRFYAVSLLMTLVATLGVVLAIAVLVLLPLLLAFFGHGPEIHIVVNIIGYGAMLAFIVVALGLLYRYGPSSPRGIFFVPGAAAATVVWLFVSWLFGWYVGSIAKYSSLYGPLATIAGLMMWFYITAFVVLFGAELNVALDRQWRDRKQA